MKTLKYFAMATMALVLASCGGKSEGAGDADSTLVDGNGVQLEVEENKMGDFSTYASFSGSVVIKAKDGSEGQYVLVLPMEVKKAFAWKYNLNFDLTICDADHVKIANITPIFFQGEYDSDNGDFNNYFLAGTQREEHSFSLSAEEWEKVKTQGKYLTIECEADSEDMSAYTKGGSSSSSSDDDSYSSDDSDSDDDDWDALLDSYESYVNQYINVMKKAQNGDMDAMSEYPELLEKAQEFAGKLENAQGNMSPSQLSRYSSITNKMARAAM